MAIFGLDGNYTRAELLQRGINDDAISRACRAGQIDRVGPGIYGPPTNDSREQRYRELTTTWSRKTAQRMARPTDRALADVSAAAVLGLPLWGLPIQRITAQDFTRPVGSRESRHVRLATDRRAPAYGFIDGVAVPVTTPARTVVDIARRHQRIPAIVVGDAALHAELCTLDDLARELDIARGMTGIGRARSAIALMSDLTESVLESRSRIAILDAGLPTPELQRVLVNARGEFLARVDFYWPQFRLVGEADGKLKYTDDPAAVLREKQRTDRLHEVGFRVVRWDWNLVNDPPRFAARLRTMMTPATSFPQIDLTA